MYSLFPSRLRDWLPKWLNQPFPPSPPSTTLPDKIYRPHDAHDVYHVAFILKQVLVPDLVPTILDLAEYWTKTSHERKDPQSYVEDSCGRPYLSIAVSNVVGPRMVRKVEISITSHDQGWSSYPQSHGTYEGSWTWFEAEIHPSEGEIRSGVQRTLCRNVHAGRKDKTHVVEWRYNAVGEDEGNLVRSLRPGTVISVVPWARFPGWRNYVSCASIDIYCAAVRRL
jgi:hypothetical protein